MGQGQPSSSYNRPQDVSTCRLSKEEKRWNESSAEVATGSICPS